MLIGFGNSGHIEKMFAAGTRFKTRRQTLIAAYDLFDPWDTTRDIM